MPFASFGAVACHAPNFSSAARLPVPASPPGAGFPPAPFFFAPHAACAAPTHAVSSRTCPCPAQALFLGRYPSKKCQYHRHNLHATVLKPGTRTIQVYPKDLRALPGHPAPAVSWHSGFRRGAHARHKTTPVDHATRRRGRPRGRSHRPLPDRWLNRRTFAGNAQRDLLANYHRPQAHTR